METVPEYTLPYLHPVVVHAPLACLLFGALAAAGWAVTARPAWRLVTLALTAAGTAASWLAVETGETLYDGVQGAPEVEALIKFHAQGATRTLWIALVATVLLAAATVWLRRRGTPRDPLWLRLALTLLVWFAAAAVVWTGHLGGLMVWGVPG